MIAGWTRFLSAVRTSASRNRMGEVEAGEVAAEREQGRRQRGAPQHRRELVDDRWQLEVQRVKQQTSGDAP